jgi:ABC-type polysaccharide/polyol phosphate transport system ATPase subunit
MTGAAIEVAGVSMSHRVDPSPAHRLWGALRGGRPRNEVEVLHDIDLRVDAGESIAVLGHNGAGKSTLLHLLAGVLAPTSGQVRTSGLLAALLDLGGGFLGDLSGRANARFFTDVAGSGGPLTAEEEAAVIDFSGLADHIDRPVRTYSNGMLLRLGFAVATVRTPDVLLVDEVLAVGDARFQRRCHARIADMRAHGTTLVLVTHQVLNLVDLCDRVVVLEGGRLVFDGSPAAGIQAYFRTLLSGSTDLDVEVDRYGDGRATIVDPRVHASGPLAPGSEVALFFHIDFREQVDAHVTVTVTTTEGMVLYGATPSLERGPVRGAAGERARVQLRLRLAVSVPDLFVDLALFDHVGEPLDVRPGAVHLTMTPANAHLGLADLGATLHVSEPAREA